MAYPMIIFAGIVASFPEMIKSIYEDYFVNVPSDEVQSSLIFVACLIVAVLVIVYFTTYVQQAEYKIPNSIYKDRTGRSIKFLPSFKSKSSWSYPSYLCKFITAAPAAILQFLSATQHDAQWVRTLQDLLATTTPSGMAMYALLIILFTFFYTLFKSIQKTAENLQKSGAYIQVYVQVKVQNNICRNYFADLRQLDRYS